MNRRQALAALGALALAPAAARERRRKPKVGLLYPNPAGSAEERARSPLSVRLREIATALGGVEFVNASAEGREDALPELARKLVREGVDVIWTAGPEATNAAVSATREIPIVFYGVDEPHRRGLVETLARPGRNVTGLAWSSTSDLIGKQLELLRELAPDVRRLAMVWVKQNRRDASGAISSAWDASLAAAAEKLAFEPRAFEVARREDYPDAFAAIRAWGPDALSAQPAALNVRERSAIAQFAGAERLPSCFGVWEFVEAGGLLSYGPDRIPAMVQSLDYVERVLRGGSPATLPVELPSKYLLAVNLRTAATLGLRIPSSILLRADRVVEQT
jgi:putative ABC transport system substrate-binding protein